MHFAIGMPRDRASAENLIADDPHQFQQWVCWQVGGYLRDKTGVDGWFNDLGGRRAYPDGGDQRQGGRHR